MTRGLRQKVVRPLSVILVAAWRRRTIVEYLGADANASHASDGAHRASREEAGRIVDACQRRGEPR